MRALLLKKELVRLILRGRLILQGWSCKSDHPLKKVKNGVFLQGLSCKTACSYRWLREGALRWSDGLEDLVVVVVVLDGYMSPVSQYFIMKQQ